MFGLFEYSDSEVEQAGRSFYGITLLKDVGSLKAGTSYPFALVFLTTDYPILRIYEGLAGGAEVHEFPMKLEEG